MKVECYGHRKIFFFMQGINFTTHVKHHDIKMTYCSKNRALRLRELENYVRRQELDKSTTAKYCWNPNHQFNFSETKKCNLLFDLDFNEATYISRLFPC